MTKLSATILSLPFVRLLDDRILAISYGIFVGAYCIAPNAILSILFGVQIGIMLLLFALQGQLLQLFSSRLFLLSLALMIWLLISLSWSDRGGLRAFADEFKQFLMTATFLAVSAVIFLEIPWARQRVPLTILPIAIIAIIVNVVAFYVIAHNPFPDERLLTIGHTNNPLDTGLVYAALAVWLMVLGAERKLHGWTLAFSLAGIGLILTFLLLSQSRSPLVALVVTAGVIALLRRPSLLIGGIPFAAIIVGALTLSGFMPVLFARGLSFRPQIWATAYDTIAQHPWLGYGANNHLTYVVDGFTFIHPHNLILYVATQGGIVAAFLLSTLIIGYGRRAWRTYRADNNVLLIALMLCTLVNAVTDSSDFVSGIDRVWFTFWMPMGMAIAAELKSRRLIDETDAGLLAGR